MFAARSRWWNSTGGGSTQRAVPGVVSTGSNARGFGAIRNGDGGKKFREQWPELDEENWKMMEAEKIDPATGKSVVPLCSPETAALGKRPSGSGNGIGATAGQVAREAGQGWLGRYRWHIVLVALFSYVVLARVLGEAK